MPKTKTAKKQSEKEANSDLSLTIVKQMTTLSSTGFSLVAALAWNNVIREAVDSYIKPYISRGSGIISLLIYAILVTILAVTVTLQLAKIEKKLTDINRNVKGRINKPKSSDLTD
jgi:hypothetical protein